MKFGFDEILAATNGSPLGERAVAEARIVTDTRALEAGDAFLALRGERFDGHDFVGDAFARGAALAVVDDASAVPRGRRGILVADTLRAYMALASAARARSRARIVAVTGSTGKTTTKSLLAQLLAHGGKRPAVTPQNENNEIGVSKLLLSLDGSEDVVVVEMGARHYGEIAELAAIARPDIGVLTNVGEAHLEIMGTRERIAETKWGLFSTGAAAILNLDDAQSRRRAETLEGREVAWFGNREATADRLLPATLIPDVRTLVLARSSGVQRFPIRVDLPGDHNRANLAAAAAAASAVGVATRTVAAAIGTLALPAGRYQRVALPGEAHLVYDAYNASLSGTLATLHAFAAETAARRIAVLGGMAELGPESDEMHARAGGAARAEGVDVLLAGGKHAQATARGAREAGMAADAIVPYADNADAIAWLRANVRAGDAILLKGSRMYKMEEILGALRGGLPVGVKD